MVTSHTSLNDLVDENINCMYLHEFQRKYHLNTNFRIFNGIFETIPMHWKEVIKMYQEKLNLNIQIYKN